MMKAKKLAIWVYDLIVFVAIVIYRAGNGYYDYSYTTLRDNGPIYRDWIDESVEYVNVLEEPFFIICVIVMALFLLVSLVAKIKGSGGDTISGFKVIAYIAALVSVIYMYSGEGDWIVVAIVGIISIVLELCTDEKECT